MTGVLLLYALSCSVALYGLGIALERIASARRRSRRRGWLVVLGLTALLPALALQSATRTTAAGPAPAHGAVEAHRDVRTAAPTPAVRLLPVVRPLALVPALPPGWNDRLHRSAAAAAAIGLAAVLLASCGFQAWVRRLPTRVVAGERVRVAHRFGPAAAGGAVPQILLPDWALSCSVEDQRLIVAHERAHVDARDPDWLLVALLLAAVQPWNPVVWGMLRRLRVAMELDCDARVLAHDQFEPARVRAYGLLLLDTARRASRGSPLVPALGGASRSLHRRLIAMTAPRHARPVSPRLMLAAAFSGAVALSLSLGAQTPPQVVRRSAPSDSVPRVVPAQPQRKEIVGIRPRGAREFRPVELDRSTTPPRVVLKNAPAGGYPVFEPSRSTRRKTPPQVVRPARDSTRP